MLKRTLILLVSLIVFTILFFFLRNQTFFDVDILISNLGGLTYLYSTIAIIFALFSAFIILFESERWNSLVDAVKGEVGQLNELWFWSQHLPKDLRQKFSLDIKNYTKFVIDQKLLEPKKSNEMEDILHSLHNDIYEVQKRDQGMMTIGFSAFSDLIKCREKRMHYSTFRLPKLLKNTLYFSSGLLILSSLLIGVKSFWLDYIFTISIFSLVVIILILIEDLDEPISPGSFHVNTSDYKELFEHIESHEEE